MAQVLFFFTKNTTSKQDVLASPKIITMYQFMMLLFSYSLFLAPVSWTDNFCCYYLRYIFGKTCWTCDNSKLLLSNVFSPNIVTPRRLQKYIKIDKLILIWAEVIASTRLNHGRFGNSPKLDRIGLHSMFYLLEMLFGRNFGPIRHNGIIGALWPS